MAAAMAEWREIIAIRPPMWGELKALACANGVGQGALSMAIARAGLPGFYAAESITKFGSLSRKINSQVAKTQTKRKTR